MHFVFYIIFILPYRFYLVIVDVRMLHLFKKSLLSIKRFKLFSSHHTKKRQKQVHNKVRKALDVEGNFVFISKRNGKNDRERQLT